MFQKTLRIIFGLLILVAVAIGLISINHPIILKWVTGSARHLGKPAAATIFTDGQKNNDIEVFYTDEPNNFLVSLATYQPSGRLKFININLNEKWIGTPAGSSKKDYDFIAGHLFQSNTGARFIPIQHEMKGFNFNPQLSINGKQIKFNLPPKKLGFDSLRIVLP